MNQEMNQIVIGVGKHIEPYYCGSFKTAKNCHLVLSVANNVTCC